jgi:hypothetical protein
VLVDRCPGSVLVGGEACNDLSAVAEPPIVAIPGAGLVKIEDVWPNPANPRVSVAFDLSRSARVQVELVNLMGQRVALLSDEPRSAGHHIIEWDGRWRNGREAATGVYIVRISADGKSAARKIVFVR